MSGFSQSAGDVRARARQGIPGMWASQGATNQYNTGLNQNPQAAQVSTVTVSGATNDKTYTITVNGVDVSYTADGSATTTEIAAGLAAAVNAEPLVRGQVSATSAAAVATLTGVTPGEVFTLTEADAELAVATTTAAASAAAIPFGRALVRTGYQATEPEMLVALAASSLFTAQVQTLTIPYVLGAIVTVSVYEIRGDERHLLASVSETSATDQATTITALVGGLNTALPANSVLVADGATTATFTAEVAGLEFQVEFSADDSGASVPALSLADTTGPSEATSFHRAFAGVSLYSRNDPAATVGGTEGEYAANAGVRFAQFGELWVESTEAITSGATAYVELGVAADNGQFFAADSATRIAVARSVARWSRDGITAADNIAALRLAA